MNIRIAMAALAVTLFVAGCGTTGDRFLGRGEIITLADGTKCRQMDTGHASVMAGVIPAAAGTGVEGVEWCTREQIGQMHRGQMLLNMKQMQEAPSS